MANDDEFADYFKSDLHARRVEEATRRTLESLSKTGQGELFAAFSEAIGMAFGVGTFYRQLGLKHQAAKVFQGVFQWLKKGTD